MEIVEAAVLSLSDVELPYSAEQLNGFATTDALVTSVDFMRQFFTDVTARVTKRVNDLHADTAAQLSAIYGSMRDVCDVSTAAHTVIDPGSTVTTDSLDIDFAKHATLRLYCFMYPWDDGDSASVDSMSRCSNDPS